ncbi:hypothetical protein ACFSTE_21080 [Aquimarina hainanensis]|uniref:Addiction module component n=1 Tax=Aquimarina hainanensis TaxID=1578017 RepID=A0ABW5NFJ0_9FLAO
MKYTKKILKFLGILSIVSSINEFRATLNEKTGTSIISPEILRILDDPEKSKILDEAVAEYKETKDWSQTRLKEIL